MPRLVHFLMAVGVALAAGAHAAADVSPDRSEFLTPHMPYAAFDRLPQQQLEVDDAQLSVAFAPGELRLSHQDLLRWVLGRARIVAGYYGGFPVASARILIVPVEGAGVKFGQTFGFRGAATRLMVGAATTQKQLDDDWVLVHELIHYAFPDLGDAHVWFQEGQATYIESVARVQAADRAAADVWPEFMQQMPKGLPAAGDEGLDRTHTWGRTYWGGAIFCLLADVEIRRRTDNRFGLQDALRAVVRAGGVTTATWSIEQAIAIGDRATGTTALHDLYQRLKDDPGDIDLDQLWKKLGIRIEGTRVVFDDTAELAGARNAIMTRPAK